MTPDQQIMFNLVMTVAAVLAGWVLRVIWTSIRDLQEEHKAHQLQMSAIRELVAGTYVTREEMDKLSEAIFRKLDRIEDKMDKRAANTAGG